MGFDIGQDRSDHDIDPHEVSRVDSAFGVLAPKEAQALYPFITELGVYLPISGRGCR